MTRILALASGAGSNFQALAEACASGSPHARVVGLICDRPGAGVLERARAAGIPSVLLPAEGGRTRDMNYRRAYDARLAVEAERFGPDFVFLLGWMRLLSGSFISRFPGKIVNLHPALPGRFPGTHAIERAYAAALAGEPRPTGAMVHFVPDEGIDSGPVILSETLPIDPGLPLSDLEERMHALEHRLVVKAAAILSSRMKPTEPAEAGKGVS